MRSIKLVSLLGIALLATSLGCKDKGGVPSEGTRPAGTGTEEQAAYVLMVKGAVAVSTQVGKEFAAQVGQGLYRSDTLRTGAGAFLVIKLQNNYLVRLDEQLELAVKDIVLINAKTTDRDFREQLDRLLNSDETTVADREGVYQRIAGWRSERKAVETVASRKAPSAAAPAAVTHEAKEATPEPSAMAEAAKPSKAEVPLAQPAPPQPEAEGAGLGAAKDKALQLAPKRMPDPVVAPAPAAVDLDEAEPEAAVADPESPTAAAPEETRAQLEQKLQSCLSAWALREQIPISGMKITLRWISRENSLVRVWLDGALPTPDCARDEVKAFLSATGAADGEDRVEVVLP